jgi:hypothetical protein
MYAPAERADTLTLFHLYPCVLCGLPVSFYYYRRRRLDTADGGEKKRTRTEEIENEDVKRGQRSD